MRYWRPAPALAPYISGYHLYATAPPTSEPWPVDVFFPAWSNLRILVTPETVWEIRQRGRDWERVGDATVFGPTSGLTWTRSSGGVAVGAGLRPAGAYHLLTSGATTLADKIAPAAEVLSVPMVGLVEELRLAANDDAIPAIFDAFFANALVPNRKVDERIAAVEAALLEPDIEDVSGLRSRIGISLRTLQRLCGLAFGLPPRLLLRRARFLRSFDAIRTSPRGMRSSQIDQRYVDYSHFTKDAQFFLGMSPQSFIALDTPLARQSMALRREVLGTPVQALGTRD
jgi:hypothetical protein